MLLLIVILPYYVLPAQVLMILLSLSLALKIISIQRLLMLPLFLVLPKLMYILVQKSFNNFANYPNKEMTTFSIMAAITITTTLSNTAMIFCYKSYCNNITSITASNLTMISITNIIVTIVSFNTLITITSTNINVITTTITTYHFTTYINITT